MKKITPTAYEVATLQDRVYRRLRDILAKEVEAHNINLSEWAILGQLHTHTSLTATEIADYLVVENPYITRMVKQLTEKKLIAISANEDDKRSRDIELTAAGKKVLLQIEKQVAPFAGKLAKSISIRLSFNYYKALQALDKSIPQS
jgi:DNA-binding MarR family transcriptional regulator